MTAEPGGGLKLHLGCGRSRRDGWMNVDAVGVPGVTDLVVDLDGPELAKVLDENSVSESAGIHVIEHLRDPLAFMEALWAVTEPGGRVVFETPHGASDDAWEDPTHVRPFFPNSWLYFGQPAYWRADYGYRGDWRVVDVELVLDEAAWAGADPVEVQSALRFGRNVVKRMRATLEAVKPAREPLAELREPIQVRAVFEAGAA